MADAAAQAKIFGKSNLRKSDKNLISTGLKAERFTNKKGINVNLDRFNMDARQKQQMAGFGEGKVRIAYVDKEGKIIPDSYYESGNIMFNPNGKGYFPVNDKNLLLHQQKITEELEDYIDTIIDFCTTDGVEKYLFDLEDAEYDLIFGPGLGANDALLGEMKIAKELGAVDCRPSYMRSLLPGSQQFAACAHKKRMLIAYFRPIIEDGSETKTGPHGEPGAYEAGVESAKGKPRDAQVRPIVV